MKKSLRIFLAAVVLAAFAPVALGDDASAPGDQPTPPTSVVSDAVTTVVVAVLSVLGL